MAKFYKLLFQGTELKTLDMADDENAINNNPIPLLNDKTTNTLKMINDPTNPNITGAVTKIVEHIRDSNRTIDGGKKKQTKKSKSKNNKTKRQRRRSNLSI